MTGAPALRRVLGAPWLWLGLTVVQVALAAALATPLRAVVRLAMAPFFHDGGTRLVGPLLELLAAQRSVGAAVVAAVATAAAFAAVLAPLLAGFAIARLAARCPVGEQARAAFAHLPAAVVIGVYGHVLRVLCLFVAAALGTLHWSAQLAVTVAGLALAAAAVDLARARTVLTGARGLHPRTFAHATAFVVQRPGMWLRSGLLTVTSWLLVVGAVLAALHGMGTAWAPWLVRGLALVGVFVGLWRIAVAVDAVAPPKSP